MGMVERLRRLWKQGLAGRGDRFIARHRRSVPMRWLACGSEAYLRAYKNRNYDQWTNGEGWLLATLCGTSVRCLFDVGASVGDWTATARGMSPQAVVHCFEAAPQTAARLRRRFAADARVVVNAVGLADHGGEIRLRHFPDAVGFTTSVADYPRDLPHIEVTAPVTTGDDYVDRQGIEAIDLLKIDVEGGEPQVLRGFERSFVAGRIAAVQFEYGRVNILTRFLLKDFYEFFDGHGFTVGKLYPNYLDLRAYRLEDEDFVGPNFVAVRRDRQDLLDRLVPR